MEEKKIVKDIFEFPNNEFSHHLLIENNVRIIFSGKYGIGKTTFLKNFFKQPKFDNLYNVIHLFPVNYSILTNEDIFRYLKFDIIYDLLVNHGDKFQLEAKHFSYLDAETTPEFVLQNLPRIAASLLLLIPKMGKQYHELSKEVGDLAKKLKEYHISKGDDEMGLVNNYIEDFLKQEGEAYEFNVISQLIVKILEDIKLHETQLKKNVLIIDDLDRIEPSHVFRIFNVFAAHFDERHPNANKFGFDHILFVCDEVNIRAIFKNFYGHEVDFFGYIDKFYSHSVFHFDNSTNVVAIIEKIIDSFQLTPDTTDNIKNYSKIINSINQHLIFILINLVLNQSINLRSLFKFYEKSSIIRVRKVQNRSAVNWNVPIILAIEFLTEIFGSLQQFREAVKSCSIKFDASKTIDELDYKNYVGDLITILSNEKHKFVDITYNIFDYQYVDNNEGICIYSKFYNSGIENSKYFILNGQVSKVTQVHGGGVVSVYRCNYFNLLIEAINELSRIRFLS